MHTDFLQYQHNFIVFTPLPPNNEFSQITCQHRITLKSQAGFDFYLSFLGQLHSINAICITIPAKTDQVEISRLVKKTTNHAVSVLSFTYDANITVLMGSKGALSLCRISNDIIPKLDVEFSQSINKNYVVDFANIENTYKWSISEDRANIFALLAESQNLQIPAHYRILSVMRALEMRFPDKKQMQNWLSLYESDFRILNISDRQFKNAMPELRNWCAHGYGNGNTKERKPFVGSVFAELPLATNLLDLLRRVLIDHIGKDFAGTKILIHD